MKRSIIIKIESLGKRNHDFDVDAIMSKNTISILNLKQHTAWRLFVQDYLGEPVPER